MVGVFTHVSLAVYLERTTHSQFSGSFFKFYPHYFEGMYGFGGNFAWMGLHLWYLEALFIFSMLCLPVFLWLKRTSLGQRGLQQLGNLLAFPPCIYLLALPTAITYNLFDPDGLGTTVMGGWSIFNYLGYFISGFVITGLLLRELERRAFRCGVRTLCLEAARRRPLTLDFYRKHGYQETGQSFYGAVETVQFSKALDVSF